MKSIFEELPGSRYEETCTAILKYLIENDVKIRKAFLKFLTQNSVIGSVTAKHFKCVKELGILAGSKKEPTGRIDLFLQTNDFNIGIECKFGAGFGELQIETYLKALYVYAYGGKSSKSPLRFERTHKKAPVFFLLIPKYRKRKLLEEIHEKKCELIDKTGKVVQKTIKKIIHFITWENLDEMLSKKDLKDSLDEKSLVLLEHFLAYLNLSISFPSDIIKRIKTIEDLPAKKILEKAHIDLVSKTAAPLQNLINSNRTRNGNYFYGSLLKTKTGKSYGWYGMLGVDHFTIDEPKANTIFAIVLNDKCRKYLKENFKDMEKFGLKWVKAEDVWDFIEWWDEIPEIIQFNLSGKNPNFEKMETWHAVGDRIFEILSKIIDL